LTAAIEIRDLSFTYPDGVKALEGITLSIDEGERVSIVGPNGAGKSTLLLLISGLRAPTAGEVRIPGALQENGKRRKSTHGVGLIFQDPDDQIFMPTVLEDVSFGPRNLELSEPEISDRVRMAIEATGLQGMEKRAPHHLSAGEKRRVAIAGVLAMSPRILLLDEPTSGLDPRGKRETMNIIRSLPGTMLLVTHDMDLALEFSDRIILMNRLVLFDGPTVDLFGNEQLIESTGLALPRIMLVVKLLKDRGLLVSGEEPRSFEALGELLKS